MHAFPHRYCVLASLTTEADLALESDNLPTITSAPPVEFDGPGDKWSPEALLVASIASCFVLSFKAIAKASHFHWHSLRCNVEGTLDRAEGVTQFTQFHLHASLGIDSGNEAQAKRVLHKAEKTCLISNSLKVRPTMAIDLNISE